VGALTQVPAERADFNRFDIQTGRRATPKKARIGASYKDATWD
jgi:hypothetical protein